jgi:hypothetical protein
MDELSLPNDSLGAQRLIEMLKGKEARAVIEATEKGCEGFTMPLRRRRKDDSRLAKRIL